MTFRTDFKHVKWPVSMNYLLSFQFSLKFGNLCIYRDVASTSKVAVAAVCFGLVEISALLTFHCKGIKLVIAISISLAAVFTLVTFKISISFSIRKERTL